MTLSFDAWKGAAVAPTTHVVPVLPPKAGPKDEPIAANLIASLVHPERTANVWSVEFSPDGARLVTVGYPSGVVQIWDLAHRKEVRRINTPPGYRAAAEYALLTPDWKTLYVPVQKHSVKTFEREGKKQYRIEYAGEIRVWDVPSGKEKAPLCPAEGTAPATAWLAPGGRLLVCVERPGHDTADRQPKDVTVVWDLAAGKKWKLCDGYVLYPAFALDGKTAVLTTFQDGSDAKVVQLLDLATGKELAKVNCPEKDRNFSVGQVSPDGAVVPVWLGGKKGAPLEVWFLDARTLEVSGKLIGKGDPGRSGWGKGQFTPERTGSGRYVALGEAGNVLVWDVAGRKLEHTLPLAGERSAWRLAISPDGKTLAVGWVPKADKDARDPDPQDLPQPRVSLINLAGKAAPRVLVAPHGYVGGLAFSPDGKTLAFGGAGAVHLFQVSGER